MLDHMLTLHLIHVVLVSLYSRSVPASPRYWLIAAVHAGLCTLASEFLAVRTTAKSWASTNELANRAAAASEFDLRENHELEASSSLVQPATDGVAGREPYQDHDGPTNGKGKDKFVLFDQEGEEPREA